MKKLFIIILFVFGFQSMYAQMIDFGIKAGLNRSELSTNSAVITETNSATGIVAGAFGRVGLLGFFVQPEVLFSQRKGAFQNPVNGTAITTTLSYVDVPVLLGYKLLFFRGYVGPNFQFLAGAKQEASPSDPNFSKDNFNSSVVGYQAGVGFDLLKFNFDIRYDAGFGSLGKKVVSASGTPIDYSTNAKMWQFTIGFKIF